ncbi:MAG TPA: DUF3303 family protein [Candidatus Acidoferrales bacterium]|nr:DUF3303 family protein [Candidatus Acidoferrales bacterium]
MLFVAEYELSWEMLEAVIAKRLEWDDAKPDGFRFIGEYVWQDRDPPFRGVAIIEADSVEALNGFVLHYGPTLKVRLHAASDVVSGIALAQPAGARAVRKVRRKKR